MNKKDKLLWSFYLLILVVPIGWEAEIETINYITPIDWLIGLYCLFFSVPIFVGYCIKINKFTKDKFKYYLISIAILFAVSVAIRIIWLMLNGEFV